MPDFDILRNVSNLKELIFKQRMIVIFHFLKKMTPDIGGPYSSIENIISATLNKDLIHIVFVEQLSKQSLRSSNNFEILNAISMKKKYQN